MRRKYAYAHGSVLIAARHINRVKQTDFLVAITAFEVKAGKVVYGVNRSDVLLKLG